MLQDLSKSTYLINVDDLPFHCPKCGVNSPSFATLCMLKGHLEKKHSYISPKRNSFGGRVSPLSQSFAEESHRLEQQLQQALEREWRNRLQRTSLSGDSSENASDIISSPLQKDNVHDKDYKPEGLKVQSTKPYKLHSQDIGIHSFRRYNSLSQGNSTEKDVLGNSHFLPKSGNYVSSRYNSMSSVGGYKHDIQRPTQNVDMNSNITGKLCMQHDQEPVYISTRDEDVSHRSSIPNTPNPTLLSSEIQNIYPLHSTPINSGRTRKSSSNICDDFSIFHHQTLDIKKIVGPNHEPILPDQPSDTAGKLSSNTERYEQENKSNGDKSTGDLAESELLGAPNSFRHVKFKDKMRKKIPSGTNEPDSFVKKKKYDIMDSIGNASQHVDNMHGVAIDVTEEHKATVKQLDSLTRDLASKDKALGRAKMQLSRLASDRHHLQRTILNMAKESDYAAGQLTDLKEDLLQMDWLIRQKDEEVVSLQDLIKSAVEKELQARNEARNKSSPFNKSTKSQCHARDEVKQDYLETTSVHGSSIPQNQENSHVTMATTGNLPDKSATAQHGLLLNSQFDNTTSFADHVPVNPPNLSPKHDHDRIIGTPITQPIKPSALPKPSTLHGMRSNHVSMKELSAPFVPVTTSNMSAHTKLGPLSHVDVLQGRLSKLVSHKQEHNHGVGYLKCMYPSSSSVHASPTVPELTPMTNSQKPSFLSTEYIKMLQQQRPQIYLDGTKNCAHDLSHQSDDVAPGFIVVKDAPDVITNHIASLTAINVVLDSGRSTPTDSLCAPLSPGEVILPKRRHWDEILQAVPQKMFSIPGSSHFKSHFGNPYTDNEEPPNESNCSISSKESMTIPDTISVRDLENNSDAKGKDSLPSASLCSKSQKNGCNKPGKSSSVGDICTNRDERDIDQNIANVTGSHYQPSYSNMFVPNDPSFFSTDLKSPLVTCPHSSQRHLHFWNDADSTNTQDWALASSTNSTSELLRAPNFPPHSSDNTLSASATLPSSMSDMSWCEADRSNQDSGDEKHNSILSKEIKFHHDVSSSEHQPILPQNRHKESIPCISPPNPLKKRSVAEEIPCSTACVSPFVLPVTSDWGKAGQAYMMDSGVGESKTGSHVTGDRVSNASTPLNHHSSPDAECDPINPLGVDDNGILWDHSWKLYEQSFCHLNVDDVSYMNGEPVKKHGNELGNQNLAIEKSSQSINLSLKTHQSHLKKQLRLVKAHRKQLNHHKGKVGQTEFTSDYEVTSTVTDSLTSDMTGSDAHTEMISAEDVGDPAATKHKMTPTNLKKKCKIKACCIRPTTRSPPASRGEVLCSSSSSISAQDLDCHMEPVQLRTMASGCSSPGQSHNHSILNHDNTGKELKNSSDSSASHEHYQIKTSLSPLPKDLHIPDRGNRYLVVTSTYSKTKLPPPKPPTNGSPHRSALICSGGDINMPPPDPDVTIRSELLNNRTSCWTGGNNNSWFKRECWQTALVSVFNYLDSRTLMKMGQVCHDWLFVSRHPALWRNVSLNEARITSKDLKTLSKWCTQLKFLNLEGLQARKKRPNESPEEYSRNTRGCLDEGFEHLVKTCGNTLLSLRVASCGNILTDRCLWLISRYCPYLQCVIYISSTYPAGPEVIKYLGGGCRHIGALIIPAMYPNERPEKFTNKCLKLISKYWPDMRILTIGGVEVDIHGLKMLIKNCKNLATLEMDHMCEVTEEVAAAMCRAGLKKLDRIDISFTPVTPKALLHFYNSCPRLESIVVHFGISDYFKDTQNPEHQKEYENICQKIKSLTRRPGLSEVLKVKTDYL